MNSYCFFLTKRDLIFFYFVFSCKIFFKCSLETCRYYGVCNCHCCFSLLLLTFGCKLLLLLSSSLLFTAFNIFVIFSIPRGHLLYLTQRRSKMLQNMSHQRKITILLWKQGGVIQTFSTQVFKSQFIKTLIHIWFKFVKNYSRDIEWTFMGFKATI